MKPLDPWRALLDKASQDERAVDGLATFPDIAPEIVGFHLQQAAEKMLKAALGSLEVAYRFTHNLGELIHLLEVNGHPVPQELGRLRDLTPYAIEWRYDFVPPEGEDDLDLGPHREMVRKLRAWVEALLHERKNR
jgi:HEPN domain-containing protein